MTEKEAMTQYGILSGKIDTICILPLSLNIPFVTAMVPSIAKSMAQEKEQEASEKCIKFLRITLLIGLSSTIAIILFADLILKILFPNASAGSELLKLNSISIVFAMLAQTINGILQGIGKINVPAIAFFVGMIFKFLINVNWVKIEYIGIKAATIGNIICNLVVCLIGIIVLIRCKKIKFLKK